MISIRAANKSDIKVLAALAKQTYSDAFGHTFSAAELADRLEKTRSESYFTQALGKDSILVAEEAGEMIGYVQFGAVEMEMDIPITLRDGELRRLYVLSAYQNKGVGKALLNAALAHSRLADADNIYLDVWDKNTSAQRLYKNYGFVVVDDETEDWIMVRWQA